MTEKMPRWVVGPTEDVVQALMETLVDPILPSSDNCVPPSEDVQIAVAKQMHAVVFLYNYHHRKQKPELVFLEFVSFCKLAIVIRPPLIAFMKMMKESKPKLLNSDDDSFSITEKAIKDACDIALGLDASRDVPNMEGWPISKVAVLLIDSKKESCMLQFGAVTKGAWSLIEKEVNESSVTPEISAGNLVGNKRKRDHMKISTYNTDFLQLGYDTLKSFTGISSSDLEVVETHFTYSLSREKSAACFYIMRCHGSFTEREQVPLNFLVESVCGPLAEKSANGLWKTTSAVKFHHMLPYVELITCWLSRCEMEVDASNKRTSENSYSNNKCDELCHVEVSSSNFQSTEEYGPPRVLETADVNDLTNICMDSEDNKMLTPKLIVYQHRRKKNLSIKEAKQRGEAVPELEAEVDFLKSNDTQRSDEKVSSGEEVYLTSTCNQTDTASTGDQRAQLEAKIKHNLETQTISASDQLQNALTLLYQERRKLYSQMCNVEDTLASCEDNISRLRDGCDVDLARQCITSVISGKLHSLLENGTEFQDKGHNRKSQHGKPTGLSEAYLPGNSSCQDLEYTCLRNNWRLPRYLIESSQGKFVSHVVVEGKDFKLHATGGFGSNPCAAREAAATEMFTIMNYMFPPSGSI